MDEHIDRFFQRDPLPGGHGEEPEAHAHVEPFTDAHPAQGRGPLLGARRLVLLGLTHSCNEKRAIRKKREQRPKNIVEREEASIGSPLKKCLKSGSVGVFSLANQWESIQWGTSSGGYLAKYHRSKVGILREFCANEATLLEVMSGPPKSF